MKGRSVNNGLTIGKQVGFTVECSRCGAHKGTDDTANHIAHGLGGIPARAVWLCVNGAGAKIEGVAAPLLNGQGRGACLVIWQQVVNWHSGK